MQNTDREIVLDVQSIQERIGQLGQAISGDYATGNLLVIGVLKGAFIFMADLVRAIDIPLVTDFIQVSSYGTGTSSAGDILLRSPPTIAVQDYDVLVVEDIVDSGLTVQWLVDHFTVQGAASVKICALIDKAERREHPVRIDYCGFAIPKGFLVGYGLDLNEHYRGLPAIYHLKDPV
ncbi:MAG: hypoxanthine phosphoribosyltransferase [Desulfoarculaceae bacterium]|nr:hypoxanthine phosphoribosyltransferase [Desulfoarculaceae bacterium]